jgi:hypothetical protein
MVLTKIKSGSKWRYTKRDGQYFTHGATYEVLCDESEDGQFRIQDDTGNGRHHWTNEPDFYAHFERADGPIRTRKEIVPGIYGVVSVGFRNGDRDKPEVAVAYASHSPADLRAAAATLTEIADALESQAP